MIQLNDNDLFTFFEALNFLPPSRILMTEYRNGYSALSAAKAGYDVWVNTTGSEEIKEIEKLFSGEDIKIKIINEDIYNGTTGLVENFDAVIESVYSRSFLTKENIVNIISLLKPGGRLFIFLYKPDYQEDKSFYGEIVNYYKILSEYLKIEFSSRILSSGRKKILQVYIKPFK